MAFGEKSIRNKKISLESTKTITREVIETALHQYLVPMSIINHGDKITLDIPDKIILRVHKKADATSKSRKGS